MSNFFLVQNDICLVILGLNEWLDFKSLSNNPKIPWYYYDFEAGIQFQFSSYWFHQLQKQLDGCISPVELPLLFWNFIIGKICKRGQWVTALGKIEF